MTYVNTMAFRPRPTSRHYAGLGASDPYVLALQEQANASLPDDQQITEDGIIGPATCAALVQTLDAVTYGTYCNSNGTVKSSGTTSAVVKSTTVTPSATSAPSSSKTILGMPTNTVIMIALGSVAFVMFFSSSKKKKAST